MKKAFVFIAIIALLAGCATTTTREARMIVQPGVREMSKADEALFGDILTSHGGVGYADFVLYPRSAMKVLRSIEVITSYDNHNIGVERWTIQHDGGGSSSYIVRLIPDGQGGTTFAVQRDTKM